MYPPARPKKRRAIGGDRAGDRGHCGNYCPQQARSRSRDHDVVILLGVMALNLLTLWNTETILRHGSHRVEGPLCVENLCAPCFGQCVALQGKVLVYGRNASIADQHRFRRDVAGIG